MEIFPKEAKFNEMLRPTAVPDLGAIGDGATFQDNNARPNRPHCSKCFGSKRDRDIGMASLLTDMSPIENLWNVMEGRSENNSPQTRPFNSYARTSA